MPTFTVTYWGHWKHWGQRQEGWMSYSSGKDRDEAFKDFGHLLAIRKGAVRIAADTSDWSLTSSVNPETGDRESEVTGEETDGHDHVEIRWEGGPGTHTISPSAARVALAP